MKKLLLTLVMALITLGLSAQDFSQGYRGYADLGYTIGVGDYDFGRFEISTTHGYQVCPYFFVGAGVGFHFMQKYETKGMGDYALDTRDSNVGIPLYADFRGMLSKHKFGPFLDLKLGHFLTNGDGFYASLSAGVRMKTVGKQAVNLSVGYTFEKLKYATFDKFTHPGMNMDYTRSSRNLDSEGISIKIGYEF